MLNWPVPPIVPTHATGEIYIMEINSMSEVYHKMYELICGLIKL